MNYPIYTAIKPKKRLKLKAYMSENNTDIEATNTGLINSAAATAVRPDEVDADISATADSLDLETKTFAQYGVEEEITKALDERGITHPFPIQALTLPVALDGADIIGQAKTGTGKTLGFGIPLLMDTLGPGEEGWDEDPASDSAQALVILPTRELAKQVAEELSAAAKYRTVRIAQVYGGRAYEPQIEAIKAGAEVIVGTPGRLLDLINRGILRLDHVTTVVLDEADEMLDLGFLPDVEKILAATRPDRQTMLFSHAGRSDCPGQALHEPAHPYSGPGRSRRRHPHSAQRLPVRLPRARHEQGGGYLPHFAGPRARRLHYFLPHQAHRRHGHPGAVQAGFRRGRAAW